MPGVGEADRVGRQAFSDGVDELAERRSNGMRMSSMIAAAGSGSTSSRGSGAGTMRTRISPVGSSACRSMTGCATR